MLKSKALFVNCMAHISSSIYIFSVIDFANVFFKHAIFTS